MKKIISLLLAAIMIISCMGIPAMADSNIAAGVRLVVEYSVDSGVLKLSGTMSVAMNRNWATFYLLHPGKTRDDIASHSNSNPVIAYCEEIYADKEGNFEHEFKYQGTPGEYTLYFTTGYAQLTRIIDTSKDVVSESGRLEAIKALPTSYKAPIGSTVKELFKERVAELPQEMPVVAPAPIEGITEVFVDVKNGDDATATGTIDSPFKTINAALKKYPPEAGMVLYLREGTYSIDDSVDLKKVHATEELPFIISSYNNEEVIVSGGTTIKGSDFEKVTDQEIIKKLNPDVVNKIKVVDLKNKYGMTTYGDITKDSQPVLMVGESKYRIARWPNSDYTVMRKYTGEDGENGVIDSGYISVGVGSSTGPNRAHSKWYQELLDSGVTPTAEQTAMKQGFEICVEDIRPFSWDNTGDIWVYGQFFDDWTWDHCNIVWFNPEKRSIRTKTGVSWGAQYLHESKYHNKFYYYNIVEELDNPGEWFMDKKAGKLYIYPTGDISDTELTYAYSNQAQLWRLNDCKNVVINGIKFEKARRRGITIDGNSVTENVLVQNCSFTNLNNGIYIEGNYTGVINSTFKDLEAKGVTINGGSAAQEKGLIPDREFVQNCVFYNTKGINAYGIGQIISHNFVSNNTGTAIFSGSNENVIEYNEIVAGPRAVTDSGSIYINGNNMFARGNHVRYNYIHSVPAEPRAIYFDDMLSECYAYGNIVDGGWMQLHNGIEDTVYNNIFLNYTSSGGQGPIRQGPNYWRAANTAGTRWVTGALNYGSFTSRLKAGSGYGEDTENKTLTGPYAERYPLLKNWAELMYQRIDEYEAAGKTTAAAKTSAIMSPYTHTWEHTYDYTYKQPIYIEIFGNKIQVGSKDVTETRTETKTEQVNLNDYLSAARDNYYANNLMVNCAENYIDMPKTNGKYTLPHAYTTSGDLKNTNVSGFIGTIDENNVYLTSAQNPFADGDFASESNYEAVRAHIPGFEAIPYEKIGLLSEDYYVKNGKTHSISPIDTTEVSISGKDLSLQWASVPGAQEYTVEIASDAEFTNILESKTTYDLSYKVETSLESDTVYYWRVTSEATANCATGEVEISDTFKFKTMLESASTSVTERNQVGVTVYSVDNIGADNFKVTTYGYNLTEADKNATIHVACYDENDRLISTKSQVVTIQANNPAEMNTATVSGSFESAFTNEIVFNFNAPNTKKIKLFVWDAEGNMVPYTFARIIK